jgi:hypothetical protein
MFDLPAFFSLGGVNIYIIYLQYWRWTLFRGCFCFGNLLGLDEKEAKVSIYTSESGAYWLGTFF